MSSKIVCELGDATITDADLDILKSPTAWLNDNVITFYLEYLFLNTITTAPSSIVLIHPTAAFMLRLLPPEDMLVSTGNKRENPFVEAKQPHIHKVLIPINNASDPDAAGGGSHWSLLVVDKPSGVARHLDSSSGMNRQVAIETAACVSRILEVDKLRFEEPRVVQQTNGYDCGVFTLLNVQREVTGDASALEASAAREFRKDLLKFVLDHAAEE